jgi:hypothetical protein
MTKTEYIVYKVMSGRWLLSAFAGVAFLYMVITGQIDPKDALQVIIMAFAFYFAKGDSNVDTPNKRT